ncbi:hypothetical protein AAFF_G00196720 [Aldrovandia affinis]|uniref:Beta/gamma crystallin 'Greek key' domain-containing protein n=1 Tax=Aldrovandia affinis TaxID=143900 RepID=A0AAD7RIT9_9TELE|nr:hypothetical protein AAFF_G00196720 [Aldrovandia affinis]
MTDNLDVQDGVGAQDAAPGGPGAVPLMSEMAEESEDVQASAASAALSRALSTQQVDSSQPKAELPDTLMSRTDLSDTVSPDIDISLPQTKLVHNGDDLFPNTDSFNRGHAPSNNQILPEADLKVDSSSPGLSVTDPTMDIPDTESDRQEPVMQEDGEIKEAEADGKTEGGEEPLRDVEIIRGASEEAGDVMEVAPPLRQEDQEQRGETGTEDPLPSLLSVTPAEQFLDGPSGPLAAVEEPVNTQAQDDLDIMNSGYGVLSTTLSSKPILTREVKEDGRQRFHKVSLISSYDDRAEDRQPGPAAGREDAGTDKRSVVHSQEERYVPGEVTSWSSLRPESEPRSSLYPYRSSSYLDTQHLHSPGTRQEASLSALSLGEPHSHGNSRLLSERSEVHFSREPDPGGRDWVESAAPAEERAREEGINSSFDSQWLADGSLSSTQSEGPFSGVFKATRVELLPSPSPTSPDLGSPYDMDSLVDTLKSMDRPQRQRGARPAPLSTIGSLPPIVEDAPALAVKTPVQQEAQNGVSSLLSDLGMNWGSPKDSRSPLEIRMQQDAEGADQRSRGLFLPLRGPSASPSPESTPSPQLNGGSSRLDNSVLFSSYRVENGKSQAQRPLLRASSLPDSGPAMARLSSAPAAPGADPHNRAPSRYERFTFLMSPTSSVPDGMESLRISRPPSLSHNPPGEIGFSHIASSPLDLIRSPPADPLSKLGLQRSLSADFSLGSQGYSDSNHGSHFSPEPERPAVIKYRAFPDAYLTKEKEHGKLNPRPGKMLIYDRPGLCGEKIEVRSDVIDATPWELPETISIRVVRGGWVLYEKPNYKGEKVALDEGDMELTYPFGSSEESQEKEGEQEVTPQSDRKFVIGSLRRAVRDYSVPEISLFPEENAEGKKVIFRDTSEDARIFGFPIKASSIIINAGLWLVYAHPFMEGVPRVLEVGGYPNPAAWGVTKPYVGSLHPLKIGEPKVEKPNEPKMVIYDKPYFTGKSREIYTHVRDFMTRTDQRQTTFMHDVGSVKVVGGCWVGFSKANFRGHQYLLEEGEYHDWRVWGGSSSELRSVHLIRADFSEPMLVMFGQPDEEEEEEEEQTFEVTEAIPDVELYGFRTSTRCIHVLSGAWIAYSHVDFSGNQYVLEKGFYTNYGDWGAADNRICSLQPILPAPTETPSVRSQILLFSGPDFQGQCKQCKENQGSLPEKFLTKSCRVLEGSWVVYEGCDFSGNLYILSEGDYPNLTSMGCPPGCFLRSVKVIPLVFAVPSISLFGLECFEGREVSLDTEMSNLLEEGFNNHVLSVRVNSGCWVLCEHINYRGRQILLEPIEISNWLKFSELPTIGSMYPVRQRRHFFRIKNHERGHYMSIQGGVEELKSGRVVVTEQVEGMSDIWFYQDGLIKSKMAPSMSLQVMGEVEPGSKVVLWAETRKPIQTWTAQSSGSIISLTFQGMVLDIKGGKTYDRNHVMIWGESEERPSQQWEIELL